uniref:serine hydrolase n=1 Tax=Prochlorothrix hollandica TaxID=1223 RepID=UPI00333E63B8
QTPLKTPLKSVGPRDSAPSSLVQTAVDSGSLDSGALSSGALSSGALGSGALEQGTIAPAPVPAAIAVPASPSPDPLPRPSVFHRLYGWLQPPPDAAVEALVSQTLATVNAEPWNLGGVPLALQQEIFDRGQKEPQLLAFARWYQVRDRLQQPLLPQAQTPGRWQTLTQALGFDRAPTAPSPSVDSVTADSVTADPVTADPVTAAPVTAAPVTADPATAALHLKALALVEVRLQEEESAHQLWNQARRAAMAAVAQGEVKPPTIQSWSAAARHWQEAQQWLAQVPAQSLWGTLAVQRQITYGRNVTIAQYEGDRLKPNLLDPVVQRYGLKSRTYISLCRIEGNCRHWHGDDPILRPASLAKIPIALVLIRTLQAKDLPLSTTLLVKSSNYTEDSGKISVGKSYSLEALLTDMLANSGNVSSNQLMDYLGWSTLDTTLKREGYGHSRLTFKFVGARIMPANPGTKANVLTTQELTEMVRSLYTQTYRGKGVVLEALGNQVDRDLGYAALGGTAAQWRGEKTGRTSDTTGTTTIFDLGGQTYVLSLVDQAGLADQQIQGVLRDIVAAIGSNPDI